jgi:hypothetical protein
MRSCVGLRPHAAAFTLPARTPLHDARCAPESRTASTVGRAKRARCATRARAGKAAPRRDTRRRLASVTGAQRAARVALRGARLWRRLLCRSRQDSAARHVLTPADARLDKSTRRDYAHLACGRDSLAAALEVPIRAPACRIARQDQPASCFVFCLQRRVASRLPPRAPLLRRTRSASPAR